MQQDRIVSDVRSQSALSTNKVLRNTYFLLALTLAFSAAAAVFAMATNATIMSPWILLIGFYGLLFLTHATARSGLGLISVFALTGFMGYTLGPIINLYVGAGLGDVVALAFGGTAAVFFACSAYVLITKKDMSFLSGAMFALFIVVLVGMIASLFLQIPALHLALSGLFIVFSSGAILMATSRIIQGGETNYILATVELYVSLYNIFVSLLNIIGASRD